MLHSSTSNFVLIGENMEKTRDQVETQYKWKVEDIYPDIKVWEEDYKVVSSMLPKLKEYQDTFLLSARNLYDFLKYDEKVSIKLENLYTYAHLNSDTDKGSSIYQELYGKAMNLLSEYDSETAFVKPALLKEEYRKIERFIKELPELKEYEVILKRIFRYQNHTLSDCLHAAPESESPSSERPRSYHKYSSPHR